MWSDAHRGRRSNLTDLALVLSVTAVLISCIVALRGAWHWPLVGDAALMRYVVFLIHNGRAPYSQIIDINLPGSYLLEAAAMHFFGSGAIGLRMYDGFLCAIVCACAVVLSDRGSRARLCGLIAGLLFVLIHLRDGVVQAGQRDLAMGAIVLVAYGLFLRARVLNELTRALVFEFLLGLTILIKPTLAPLAVLPLLATLLVHGRQAVRPRPLALQLFFVSLPLLLTFAWLHYLGSLRAFFSVMTSIDTVHSALAHRGIVFLVVHSVAPIGFLLGVGLVLFWQSKMAVDVDSKLLLFGILCGLASFVIQGKGFPYQRYPFLMLALILTFRLIASGLGSRGFSFAVAVGTICITGFWLAPSYAAKVRSYDRIAPFEEALGAELKSRGAGHSGVQCLDTVGGCISTLYAQRIAQSTGYLYDCYAYVGTVEEQEKYRVAFLDAIRMSKPRYIVLSSQFCLEAKGRPGRMADWPALASLLGNNYTPGEVWHRAQPIHWWNQPELPPDFQVFTSK